MCVCVCLSVCYTSSIPAISSEHSVNKDYLGASQQLNERCTWVFFSLSQQEDLMHLSGMTPLRECVSHCRSQKKYILYSLLLTCLYTLSLEMDVFSCSHDCMCVEVCAHVCEDEGQSTSAQGTENKTGWKSS